MSFSPSPTHGSSGTTSTVSNEQAHPPHSNQRGDWPLLWNALHWSSLIIVSGIISGCLTFLCQTPPPPNPPKPSLFLCKLPIYCMLQTTTILVKTFIANSCSVLLVFELPLKHQLVFCLLLCPWLQLSGNERIIKPCIWIELGMIVNSAHVPLSDRAFETEINCSNPLGTGGRLAIGFAVLLRALWKGTHHAFQPSKLKVHTHTHTNNSLYCNIYLTWLLDTFSCTVSIKILYFVYLMHTHWIFSVFNLYA